MVITCVRIKPVLCVFPKVLTRKISLTIKSFFSCWLFPLFSWPPWVILRWYCKEKLDASQYWGGGGLILINPSGWRGELRVKFFPTNYNTSIMQPKLWMSSESKHFMCSCLSRFKIKSFWFANSVESVSFKTHIINYTDKRRQYSPPSCWLVFQILTVAFLQLLISHDLQCSMWYAETQPWSSKIKWYDQTSCSIQTVKLRLIPFI